MKTQINLLAVTQLDQHIDQWLKREDGALMGFEFVVTQFRWILVIRTYEEYNKILGIFLRLHILTFDAMEGDFAEVGTILFSKGFTTQDVNTAVSWLRELVLDDIEPMDSFLNVVKEELLLIAKRDHYASDIDD